LVGGASTPLAKEAPADISPESPRLIPAQSLLLRHAGYVTWRLARSTPAAERLRSTIRRWAGARAASGAG